MHLIIIAAMHPNCSSRFTPSLRFESQTRWTITWLSLVSPLAIYDIRILPSDSTLLETISVTTTNTNGFNAANNKNVSTTSKETVHCQGPATAVVNVEVASCQVQDNIDFQMTLGGWVWFHYDCMWYLHIRYPRELT